NLRHTLEHFPRTSGALRRFELRDHVAADEREEFRADLRRRAEESRTFRRCAGDRAEGPLRTHPENCAGHLQFPETFRGKVVPEYAADIRHLHAAGNVPMA